VRGDQPDQLLDTYTAERRPVAAAVLANTLAQLALLRPDPQSGALRDLFAELLDDEDANRRIGAMTSGLATRYDLGSAHDAAGRLIGNRPVVHNGAPAMLYDVMQDGGSVLLDASGLAPDQVTRVTRVTIDTGPSLLVRPDGCIAWAGATSAGLQDALEHLL